MGVKLSRSMIISSSSAKNRAAANTEERFKGSDENKEGTSVIIAANGEKVKISADQEKVKNEQVDHEGAAREVISAPDVEEDCQSMSREQNSKKKLNSPFSFLRRKQNKGKNKHEATEELSDKDADTSSEEKLQDSTAKQESASQTAIKDAKKED